MAGSLEDGVDRDINKSLVDGDFDFHLWIKVWLSLRLAFHRYIFTSVLRAAYIQQHYAARKTLVKTCVWVWGLTGVPAVRTLLNKQFNGHLLQIHN